MKVFVAGATGVLGRPLVRGLRRRGHAVVGLTRSERGRQLLRSFDVEPVQGDIFDADALARVARGCDAVVHAATAIPVTWRPLSHHWRMNDRLRREGTGALLECARRIGAIRYVQQSVVWLAAPPTGAPFDESSPAHPDVLTRSALDGERLALGAASDGLQVAVLRCGWFYDAQAAHTRALGHALLHRQAPIVGPGGAPLACLHVDDAATAFIAAVEGSAEGVYHVVDDCPVPVGKLMREFARRLGAPPPRSVPVWLARLLIGRDAVKFLTTPVRTGNSAFRAAFEWQPCATSYRVGLEMVISDWEKHGFPERSLPLRPRSRILTPCSTGSASSPPSS